MNSDIFNKVIRTVKTEFEYSGKRLFRWNFPRQCGVTTRMLSAISNMHRANGLSDKVHLTTLRSVTRHHSLRGNSYNMIFVDCLYDAKLEEQLKAYATVASCLIIWIETTEG